jgi:hypothetical protein
MSLKRCLTGLILAAIAITAAAFERPFPPQAKRGSFSSADYPTVVIDGKPRTLSAGAQIRNVDNLIVMPDSLSVRGAVINYTEGEQGDVERIWMLTREEADKPAPGAAK